MPTHVYLGRHGVSYVDRISILREQHHEAELHGCEDRAALDHHRNRRAREVGDGPARALVHVLHPYVGASRHMPNPARDESGEDDVDG